ncbi:MAG: C45 family autoproteolytic acyltransferase/hydrolase [Candidatus Hodarchaeota archaeon]
MNRNVKRLAAFSLVFVIVLGTFAGIIPSQGCDDHSKSSFAEWRESNDQTYLYVYSPSGENYEIGQLQGFYLAEKILYIDQIVSVFLAKFGLQYSDVSNLAYLYDTHIPDKYKLEMSGIADGVNLYLESIGSVPYFDYSRILVINTLSDVLHGILYPQMAAGTAQVGGCTAIGAVNRLFSWTQPVICQTIDLSSFFAPGMAWVFIHTPKYKIFMPTGGAGLGAMFGKSEYVASASTLVFSSAPGVPGTPMTVQCRIALEKAKTAREFVDLLPRTFSLNWLVADKNELYRAEVTPVEEVIAKINTTDVRTNTFTSEQMLQYVIDPEDSLEREAQVNERLDKYFHQGRYYQYIRNRHLLKILSEPPITKVSPPDKYSTVAFFLFVPGFRKGVFGIGNPRDASHGDLPF